MNRWIANDRIFAHDRRTRTSGNVDALSVPRHGVGVEDVARGTGNDADAEIVGGIGVPVAVCVIQPDPAVVSGDSNTAARIRR